MVIFVRLIGLFSVTAGIIFIIKSELMKRFAQFFIEGSRFYIIGVLRLIIGAVFLMAASQCRLPWPIIALGALILLSGITIFSIGLEKSKDIVTWMYSKPDWFLKLLSVFSIIIGGFILYSA